MTESEKLQIRYRKGSFCGEPFDEEIEETLDILVEAGWQIDESYFDHIRANNGGIPLLRYFPLGEIERMLNFTDSYSSVGARYRDFNVNIVRTWIKDRVPSNIDPFACLPHGAFLCFDYSKDRLPSVVMWNNESFDEEFVPVAETFREFVSSLRETPY
ncbi:MAG: SMI1/KNR4 family protein [bacterium]|nr:SMI1/KNR4 family protein [bacterium]